MQMLIVGQEQVNASVGRTCQLNRVRASEIVSGAKAGKSPCNLSIKADNLRS